MISKIAKQLSTLYLSDPECDLDGELAKIASEQNLNAQSIERVANRTNRNIIVGLQKEAVQGDNDPHFIFPTVKTANVLNSLRAKKPSAVPTLPDAPAKRSGLPDFDSGRPSRAAEVEISSTVEEGQDKASALNSLSLMKMKVAEKKSALNRIEFAIDDLTRRFEKSASHQLLSGTPIEVFEGLPGGPDLIKNVLEQIEGWGHKVAHVTRDFELDEGHPIVEMAFEISELRDQLDSASSELKEAQSGIDAARRSIRESSK